MNFNFDYVHAVYRIMDGEGQKEDLFSLKAHQLIQAHGKMSGMDHEEITRTLLSLEEGQLDSVGQRLLAKRERIMQLIAYLTDNEEQIKELLRQNVARVFPAWDFDSVTFYFALGYDAIGYRGEVVCSLDLNLILEDTRELISLLIHELTHVVHAQFCPAINEISLDRDSLKGTIDLLIQMEGAAILSAYPYRAESGILENVSGSMIKEDYDVTPEKRAKLWAAYEKTTEYFLENRETEEILQLLFKSRVDHALGFVVFLDLYETGGWEKVQEAALLSPDRFALLYLTS